MKKIIKSVKTSFIIVVLTSLSLYSNENINKSISSTSLPKPKNNFTVSKNILEDVQRHTIKEVGKALNINTAVFNKNRKFSIYLKVARKSRVGFKYKF